jgi:S1-C subfamily serine protease
MKTILPCVAVALAAFLVQGMHAAAIAQVSPTADVQLVAMSVGRVRASNCNGPDRVGTAFVWRDRQTVVTARHVVAGCNHITVLFTASGRSFTANPDQELIQQDLAALALNGPAPSAPLAVRTDMPAVGTKVVALGYAFGAPTLDSKELEVTLANAGQGSRVQDMLDDRLRDSLIRSGEIDVTTAVLRLDGNLLPGLSGAPVVGPDRSVYAIGSGGIAEGAGGVVWAVRAAYLEQLGQSHHVTTMQTTGQASGLAFSYQTEQANVASLTCGAVVLHRSRAASLATLSGGTDDLLGLQWLELTFGNFVTPAQVSSLEFEIWADDKSGAAIAVPEGTTLRSDDGGCSAHIGPGVDLLITAAATPTPTQVQIASSSFELKLTTFFSSYLQPDPSFSYPNPRMRSDGFIIRRAAYGAYVPLGQPGLFRADYVFVNHMARGSTYMGVAGLRREEIVDMQKAQACQLTPGTPECEAIRQHFKPWIEAALAVQLATIPPI